MARVQGIDTGSWRTRVATMEGGFRRLELTRVAESVTETDESGALRVDLGFATASDVPGEVDRVVAFPLDLGMVKLVKLPFSDRAAIAKALPAAVEASVPWDLEDMVLGSNVLEAGEGGSRIAAFIAPREEVAARVDALRALGAEPRSVVFDADALSAYNDAGVQAIVDIGHRRTVVALAVDGRLHGARLLPSGGAAFTQALADALGLSFADAEARKHAASLPGAASGASPAEAVAAWDDLELDSEVTATELSAPETQAALVQATHSWLAELRAELIALEDETGLGVDEVLLCGGGSKLAGLPERLGSELGVPARPVVVPGGHGPAFALAVALARVGARERPATDLRVGELSYRGHADMLWRLTLGAVAVAALGLVAIVGMTLAESVSASRELAKLDGKIADAVVAAVPETPRERVEGQPRVALAVLQEASTATQTRVDALGATQGGIPPTLDLLRVLSQAMPSPADARIDVRELTIETESVSFKAETDTYETAARIEDALKRNPRFTGAKKSEEKKSGDMVTFAVNIPLTSEGEAPAAPEEGG
jgi:Tfp pilus assembly PilM family ATPase